MYHPHLKPLRLERPGRGLSYDRRNRRSTERTEAHLRDRSGRPGTPRPATTGVEDRAIRISRINRISAAGYYEERHKVCLKEDVDVHVLTQVTSVPHEKLSAGS